MRNGVHNEDWAAVAMGVVREHKNWVAGTPGVAREHKDEEAGAVGVCTPFGAINL